MAFFFATLGAFLLSLGINAIVDTWHPTASLGLFSITLLHNPGIAFGVILPPTLQWIGLLLAILLVLRIALHAHERTERLAYGLILGGACANILDRFIDGVVTDYIQVGTFPIFNMADICITVGVGVLLLKEMRKNSKYRR
jgi:signal peptidase II